MKAKKPEGFKFSNYFKKISLKWWVAITIAVFVVTLFFGLSPRDFDFSNDVIWLSKPPGIRFKGYGIAFTEPIKKLSKAGGMNTDGFSIEIALKPAHYNNRGFNFLFAIHNGNDGKQLVIGQWRSWLIAMNGDDYDHSRKTKRIAAKLDEAASNPQFVTITSEKDGTKIYMDGRLIRTQRDLTLKIPKGENARLLLGNSVYGRHNWQGDVLGLAIYRYPLSGQDAAEHFKLWSKEGSFLFAISHLKDRILVQGQGGAEIQPAGILKYSEELKRGPNTEIGPKDCFEIAYRKYKPHMLYAFDEKNEEKVMDRAGGNIDFHIPSKMKILDKRILSFSSSRQKFNAFFEDVMINLIGFIPLGFILNATFAKAGEGFGRHGILITIVFCFFVSLFIEVLQAWIPSRSSDVLDLMLNTMGGGLGAYGGKRFKVKG